MIIINSSLFTVLFPVKSMRTGPFSSVHHWVPNTLNRGRYSINRCWMNEFSLLNNLYFLQWKSQRLELPSDTPKSHSQVFLTPIQAPYYPTWLPLDFCTLHAYLHAVILHRFNYTLLCILAVAVFSILGSGLFLSSLNQFRSSLSYLYNLLL